MASGVSRARVVFRVRQTHGFLRLARATAWRTTASVAPVADLEAAERDLQQNGYAVLRHGAGTSAQDLEVSGRTLLGLPPSSADSYNGRGGMDREHINQSSFLDASAGTYPMLPVMLHNEMGYNDDFPRRVSFAMLKSADSGGMTLVADNLRITQLLSQSLLSKIAELGFRYVRHMHDEAERGRKGFYMSWQGAFRNDNLEEVLSKNREQDIEWRKDHACLRHAWRRYAFHRHPVHGKLLLASVLVRHGSCFDGHPDFDGTPLADRPLHCLWGDGSELSQAELQELRAAYEMSTSSVSLADGDLIVLDNLRFSHGRTPYRGSRKIGILISEFTSRDLGGECPT